MVLRRIIPQRTEILGPPLWCKQDFSHYTKQWRAIRGKCRNKMDKCFWCKKPFIDGDQIALADPALIARWLRNYDNKGARAWKKRLTVGAGAVE